MQPKKILLVIPELIMGGAQRSLSKLSLMLSKDHRVWIVIFNRKDPVTYAYGGELLSLDVDGGNGILGKANALRARVNRLRKIKKELNVDVSISFLEGADYINVLSRSGEKIILSIRGSKRHDENIDGNFSWIRHNVFIPWLYRKADLIVTVNSGIIRELVQYGIAREKCVTIGNFYNLEEIKLAASEPKSENVRHLYEGRVLVTTGRLAREKGLAPLLEVFSVLKKENADLRFVIVGEGPLQNELYEQAQRLALNVTNEPGFTEIPDVYFTGQQPNVFKYLQGATLYLMNSSSEGFPNGLAEAMICNVPVMSSDCPYGPREILAPEFEFSSPVSDPYIATYGILMPMINASDDIKPWIESLRDVLKKPELLTKLAQKGGERIGIFDHESAVSQWLNVLDRKE
jgi:glycosyltransferase involved in cell wall biosynthesis